MPILNGTSIQRKEKIKAEVSHEIYNMINEYCKWAHIPDMGSFIAEAAAFVFAKDREWKQHNKLAKKREDNLAEA